MDTGDRNIGSRVHTPDVLAAGDAFKSGTGTESHTLPCHVATISLILAYGYLTITLGPIRHMTSY